MVLLKKILTKIMSWIISISAVQTWDYDDFGYGTGVTYYNTTNAAPRAIKYGRTVNITGAVKPTTQITAGTTKVIATLPPGCEPVYNEYRFLQQGSGQNKFNLLLRTDGRMQLQNYGTTSNIAVPANAWLNINATYLAKE